MLMERSDDAMNNSEQSACLSIQSSIAFWTSPLRLISFLSYTSIETKEYFIFIFNYLLVCDGLTWLTRFQAACHVGIK